MFIINSESQFDNAKAKIKKMSVKPKCKIVRFGQYKVQGSRGNWYDVACLRNAKGEKVVSCACETRDGVACYHALVAVSIHIVLAEQLQSPKLPANVLQFTPKPETAVKPEDAPYMKPTSGKKPEKVGNYRI